MSAATPSAPTATPSATPSPSASSQPDDDSVGSLTAAVDRVAFQTDDAETDAAIAADVARWLCDENARAVFVMLQRADVIAVMEELHDLRDRLAHLAAPASGDATSKVYDVLRECQTVKDIDTKLAIAPGMSVITTGDNDIRAFVDLLGPIRHQIEERAVRFVSPFDNELKRIPTHGGSINGAETALRNARALLQKCEFDLERLCKERMQHIKNIVELEIKNDVYRAYERDIAEEKQQADAIKVQIAEERARLAAETRKALKRKHKQLTQLSASRNRLPAPNSSDSDDEPVKKLKP